MKLYISFAVEELPGKKHGIYYSHEYEHHVSCTSKPEAYCKCNYVILLHFIHMPEKIIETPKAARIDGGIRSCLVHIIDKNWIKHEEWQCPKRQFHG